MAGVSRAWVVRSGQKWHEQYTETGITQPDENTGVSMRKMQK